MKKFTLGVAAGMSSLALAIPIMAQVAGAQSSSSAAEASAAPFRSEFAPKSFTQEDVQKMIERDEALLANIDAFVTLQKSSTEAHKSALTAALSITDDTARQEAVQAANEAQRTAMKEAMEANPSLAGAMHHGMHKGQHMMKMRGGPGMLEEKLGMTMEELKAALESGKTIEQIAEEKGVELPERPEGTFMFKHMRNQAQSSSAQ